MLPREVSVPRTMAPPARNTAPQRAPKELLLLGDEAVAQGAIDAGITTAYGYPGTPSTEAFEYLARPRDGGHAPRASWCVNEKVAMESALGTSMVGRRSLVVMKHVGLNVAADPFINAALVKIHGGVVVLVADDPGMHSSQNEQDSRFYADFARVPCLEPADHQEAYEMTREAFELSERFAVPVMVRLVTRLAHARDTTTVSSPLPQRPLDKTGEPNSWILIPANARRLNQELLDGQQHQLEWSEGSRFSRLDLVEGATPGPGQRLGVITAGLALAYYREVLPELAEAPAHLHVGTYPAPARKIRELAERVDRLLVLEDGYPFLERQLGGLLPVSVTVEGRRSGALPAAGELDPDRVRRALGLRARITSHRELPVLPARPPQLCQACPHRDSFSALREALAGIEGFVVTGDIGCYALGALPPFQAIESCVCMGSAVGMARGAAQAGSYPVVGVIGDSTFLHSGVAPLIDAVNDDTDMTLLILDNEAIGMTGAQDTAVPSSQLEPLILGLGVDPEHCHVIEAHPHPRKIEAMAVTIRREIEHRGLSVVVIVRECIEHARKRKAAQKREQIEP